MRCRATDATCGRHQRRHATREHRCVLISGLPACLPISSRISIHDEQIREKLRESLFDSMDLEGYGNLLLESHGVLKTDTLIDIRTELLAPFAESRLLPAAGTGLLPWELSKADEFNLLTGESMRRRPGHRATDGAWHGSDAL